MKIMENNHIKTTSVQQANGQQKTRPYDFDQEIDRLLYCFTDSGFIRITWQHVQSSRA